uniref:F5/8 type C domain-containing protein n=1 Tax=Trichobilharzia regenti TaxID=157069 RepID=A0AA85JU26_TRIRE|nr:unnamed protein product [Trichobilharzia regenti]
MTLITMWIYSNILSNNRNLTPHPHNVYTFLHVISCLLLIPGLSCSQVSNGIKSINKDLGPLTLPPSAFSASSVYQDKPEYQPHKANFVVFASKEEISGAWCPAKLIHTELNEWLQIDFGALKLIKVLFSEGGGLNQNAFVPMFVIKYQREDNSKWYEYRMRNGSRLLHANRNSQTIAIQLDPPIIAKRFRVLPYTNEPNPKLMCLRLAVYGSVFDDGVIEYSIPEGDVYRLDPRGDFALNDTSYDGGLTSELSATSNDPDNTGERRAYLTGGMGLLMDKQYFEGSLPENLGSNSVVGWFRRQHTTPSGRITMLFKFDQVRNFTRMRIHALNSLDYIALFRRVSVQFSNGGRYFDRNHSPVVVDIHRDVYNSQPRWLPIDLGYRTGRYLRITLWFDYDWIVLSEITFDSSYVPNGAVIQPEQSDDPVQKIPDFDSSGIDSVGDSLSAIAKSSDQQSTSPPMVNQPSVQNDPGTAKQPTHSQASLSSADVPISATFKHKNSNVPYIIAIISCCLGSFAFACFFAFMVFRLKRCRQRRLKKLQKGQLPQTLDKQPMHQHLLLTTGQNQNSLSSTLSVPSSSSSSGPCIISSLNPSYQYNQLKSTGNNYTTDNGSSNNNNNKINANAVNLQNPTFVDTHSNHLAALSQGYTDMMTHPTGTVCTPYSNGIDQDGLLALQLLQHGSSVGSNFPSMNGLTLARRGLSDASTGAFAVHPMVTLGTENKFIGVNLPPAAAAANCTFAPNLKISLSSPQSNNNNAFGSHQLLPPPPPPDQPLPPLPNIPSDHHQQHIISNVGNQLPDSNNQNNRLLINTSLSPVFPYAATSSFVSQAYPTENGFILSIDSPMPEYASASLFSGTGSGTISLGPNDLRNSIISKTTMDSDTSKYKQLMETYCVPQHMNSCFWTSNSHPHNHQQQLNLNGMPNLSTSASSDNNNGNNNTQGSSNNEQLSESMDSSGMYYLTHKNHTDNNNINKISSNSIHQNPAVFFPFSAAPTAATHLIPIQTLGVRPGILVSNRDDQTTLNQSYQHDPNQSIGMSMTNHHNHHHHHHQDSNTSTPNR